jgi:hypothetical protein
VHRVRGLLGSNLGPCQHYVRVGKETTKKLMTSIEICTLFESFGQEIPAHFVCRRQLLETKKQETAENAALLCSAGDFAKTYLNDKGKCVNISRQYKWSFACGFQSEELAQKFIDYLKGRGQFHYRGPFECGAKAGVYDVDFQTARDRQYEARLFSKIRPI